MEELRPIEIAALEQIEQGATMAEAAAYVDRDRRQLNRWMNKNPAFAVAVRAARLRAVRSDGIDAAGEAQIALVAMVRDENTPPQHRLKAASLLLRHGLPPEAHRVEVERRSVTAHVDFRPLLTDGQLADMTPAQLESAMRGLIDAEDL